MEISLVNAFRDHAHTRFSFFFFFDKWRVIKESPVVTLRYFSLFFCTLQEHEQILFIIFPCIAKIILINCNIFPFDYVALLS